MSDINEKELEFDDEEQEEYITLIDENGQEVSFEMLDIVEYKDRNFGVLLPFDEEDDGVVILELVPTDDPEFDEFVAVEDETLLNEVFEKFKKNYQGEYEFE